MSLKNNVSTSIFRYKNQRSYCIFFSNLRHLCTGGRIFIESSAVNKQDYTKKVMYNSTDEMNGMIIGNRRNGEVCGREWNIFVSMD